MRSFTVLPNGLLQDRRLSYTARGLLADLLSRPDGRREDGRSMADTSPQGRGAIRKALKELTEAGYYRVDRIRLPDGTIRSEAHAYDTPQRPDLPDVPRPTPGDATTGHPDTPPVKNPAEEPTLPAQQTQHAREAMATLFRVIRPEPRLHLGEAEALKLAPLVTQWLERGSNITQLTQALLPGLPATVHSPAAVLRHRLTHKMPPTHSPEQPPTAQRFECAECHDPVPQAGICRPCAGFARRAVTLGGGAGVTTAGAARARAAMNTARSVLGVRRLAPAVAG
ncbi:hypothetical protein [Kitasatospora sp. McL0602]|uniref:hypothetical protein n=1 Tax=Kitasatospora sp. McL0602 TaxID=3439530 RepID=UPI003F8A9711